MKLNLNTSMKRNLADWSKLKYVEWMALNVRI